MKLMNKLIATAGLALLAAAPAFGTISTPISNLGQSAPGAWNGYYVDDTFSPAVSFTTGSDATSLSSISILAQLYGYGYGNFSLSLYSNSGSTPGTSLTTLTGSNPVGFTTYTFTDPNSTLLAADTTYWIVATDTTDSSGEGYIWNHCCPA
jgi:hypothetical protein